MFHPINWVIDRYIPSTLSKHQSAEEYTGSSIDFIRVLTWLTFGFVWILYVVAAAYPAWPLFHKCSHYWNLQLVVYPLTIVTLARDAATTAYYYVTRTLALLSIGLSIYPFILICTEMYMCNQLTDAEKLIVATCHAAYVDNYIDPQSALACKNLVNIDITSIAHGSCAYLVDQVAGLVEACEFLLLVLITYKDVLIFFTIARVIQFRTKPKHR